MTTKCTDKDFQVALCELQVAGLIEFMPDNEEAFHLTEKGLQRGRAMLERLPVKDRLVLFMTKDAELDDSVERDEEPV